MISECQKLEVPRLPTSTGTIDVIIQNSTPISKVPEEEHIFVYTNPTTNNLSINFDIQTLFTEGAVGLLDLTVKVTLNQEVNNSQKQFGNRISLKDYVLLFKSG